MAFDGSGERCSDVSRPQIDLNATWKSFPGSRGALTRSQPTQNCSSSEIATRQFGGKTSPIPIKPESDFVRTWSRMKLKFDQKRFSDTSRPATLPDNSCSTPKSCHVATISTGSRRFHHRSVIKNIPFRRNQMWMKSLLNIGGAKKVQR